MVVQEKLSGDLGHALGRDNFLSECSWGTSDISFPLNKVCQYLSKPINVSRKRYIKEDVSIGLCIKKNTSKGIFTNVSLAGCACDCRSTTGLISWSARKQPMVSRSSTEVEYKALANGRTNAMWIQSILLELLICSALTTVFLV
jgi:hypothetical protein